MSITRDSTSFPILDAVDALDRAHALIEYVISHNPVRRSETGPGEVWVLDAAARDIDHVRKLLQQDISGDAA